MGGGRGWGGDGGRTGGRGVCGGREGRLDVRGGGSPSEASNSNHTAYEKWLILCD